MTSAHFSPLPSDMHLFYNPPSAICAAGISCEIAIVDPQQLDACLDHLEAAETLMMEGGDLAGLSRLTLVIEMLRRAHGMPDRPIDLADFGLGLVDAIPARPQ